MNVRNRLDGVEGAVAGKDSPSGASCTLVSVHVGLAVYASAECNQSVAGVTSLRHSYRRWLVRLATASIFMEGRALNQLPPCE